MSAIRVQPTRRRGRQTFGIQARRTLLLPPLKSRSLLLALLQGGRISPPRLLTSASECRHGARKAQATERRTESRRAAAADQMTRPFEVLEAARRDRIEMEKRFAQEKANEARAAREQKAKERAEAKRGAAQKPESERGGNTPTAPTKSN